MPKWFSLNVYITEIQTHFFLGLLNKIKLRSEYFYLGERRFIVC